MKQNPEMQNLTQKLYFCINYFVTLVYSIGMQREMKKKRNCERKTENLNK